MTATVLVLTRHPTLTVALTLTGEWHVVEHADDVAPVQQGDAVVVLDAGGEVELPPWADPARTILLTADTTDLHAWPGLALRRPYRLDELADAIRRLAAPSASPPAAADPEPVLVPASEPVAESVAEPLQTPGETAQESVVAEPTDVAAPDLVVVAPEPPVPASPDPEAEVGAATVAAEALLDLLRRFPAMGSRRELTQVLAEEIGVALEAASVGVWCADDGPTEPYTHLAGVGLTAGETRMLVAPSHPLVADALASGGTAIEDVDADPAQVVGLPASRHPTLVVVPLPATPVGELLVIAGLSTALPTTAFDAVEAAAASMTGPMRLCATLGTLATRVGDR